jgi:hypothetical protein
MKQLLVTLCFALTGHFGISQSKLINYFNKLPKEHKHDFVISKKGETYTAEAGTGPCKVLVDDKNGFLEIKDSGTGGGILVYQLAIFKNAKKQDVLAVNYYAYEDLEHGMIEGGNIHFFSVGKQLVDITKDILPDMTTVEDKAYNGQSNAIMNLYKEGFYEYFELPRVGTTLKFYFGSNSLNQACENKDEQACNIKKSLQVVELFWHRDTGYLSLMK